MTTELEHLRRMRELLAKGWTQGAEARDASGNPTHAQSRKAVSFCPRGAAIHVSATWGHGPRKLKSLAAALNEMSPLHEPLETWNDSEWRKQSHVLALIDRAIEIAEAGQ